MIHKSLGATSCTPRKQVSPLGLFPISNMSFDIWLPEAHNCLINQNALPIALTVSESSNSKTFSESQENFLTVILCKVNKNVMYLSHTMYFCSTGKNKGRANQVWTKVRSKVKNARLTTKAPFGIQVVGRTIWFPALLHGVRHDFNLCFYAILTVNINWVLYLKDSKRKWKYWSPISLQSFVFNDPLQILSLQHKERLFVSH